MVANNMNELRAMIQAEMLAAMTEARTTMETTLKKEVSSFYTQGKPKVYVRTGALGKSPKVDPISGAGNNLSFKIYLDTNYSYNMPNPLFRQSWYSTEQVIQAAENHTSHILGKPGFWQRSEAQFQNLLDSAMAKHFN